MKKLTKILAVSLLTVFLAGCNEDDEIISVDTLRNDYELLLHVLYKCRNHMYKPDTHKQTCFNAAQASLSISDPNSYPKLSEKYKDR